MGCLSGESGVKGFQACFEQRAFVRRPDSVGSQDRELVTAVLLAQPTDDILAIVVLRQSRGSRQSETKGNESAGHFSSKLPDKLAGSTDFHGAG